MKYRVGIFGSAVSESPSVVERARVLGKVIVKFSNQIILLTGACPGIPYEVARAAKQVKIIGYSPEISYEKAADYAGHDMNFYDEVHLLPKTLPFSQDPMVRKKFRNVIFTAHCDAGIVVSGRWGTLNEFTNMHDMGKVIGVLTGTGGVSDELPTFYKKIHKPSKAVVFFSPSPTELVSRILKELEKRK